MEWKATPCEMSFQLCFPFAKKDLEGGVTNYFDTLQLNTFYTGGIYKSTCEKNETLSPGTGEQYLLIPMMS